MNPRYQGSKPGRVENEPISVPAQGEMVLREALREAAARVPDPPARLPDSLLQALPVGTKTGAWRGLVVLVLAQWPVVSRERLMLALAVFLPLVFGAAAQLMNAFDLLTLTGALPIAAGLLTLLLSGPWADPAHAVVSTTRTPFGAVVLARTTVALALLVVMGMVGSLVLAGLGDRMLSTLVAAWLGPTVVIAAQATLLTQLWRPLIGVTVALASWATVIFVIALELMGTFVLPVSLSPLVQPGAWLIVMQVVVGAGLVAAAWFIGARSDVNAVRA